MYKEHPVFIKPKNKNVKIWRYLDFTKFVSLLDQKALFFTRADKLEDPFEGSITKLNEIARKQIIKDLNLPTNIFSTGIHWRRYVIINSWHMNEDESAALWKIYLKSEEGVAIQTTFQNLIDSFNVHVEDDIHVGVVKYTDYDNEIIPGKYLFSPFLNKRKSFEHEKEIRALIIRSPITDENREIDFSKEIFEEGLLVKVDLEKLINKVYTSPYSERWFHNLVKSVANKYLLKAEVLESSLKQEPIF